MRGKERIILELLHGVNELHHALANSLLRWGYREEDWTPEALSRQLLEVAQQYRIVRPNTQVLTSAKVNDCNA